MGQELAKYLDDWRPAPLSSEDVMAPEPAQRLAATLDLDENICSGTPLSPLWHWVYFTEWPATEQLGPDGHPAAGHFLPPIPHRRRMMAGGRMTVTSPLVIGRPAERQAEVTASSVKSGRTGDLLFVTVRQQFRQGGALCIVEEQDIVYRSDTGSSTSFTRAVGELPAPTAPWSARPRTHPTLLFRFSALTANAHRIHYDDHYTVGVEGFPALVVHGPLLAMYMADLARMHGHRLRSFEFRLRRPAFVGDAIEVQGTPDGDTLRMAVVSPDGSHHATATAT
jgi:3-methylfumaryl-CoA hydratase